MTGWAASCCSHRSRAARRCSTNSGDPIWPSTGPFFSGRGGMKYPRRVCFSSVDSACGSAVRRAIAEIRCRAIYGTQVR